MPGPIESAGGIKEPTEYATLSMDAQFTGLWTQRNPLRDADVPYLYRKFYSASRFDSMLDGINREISARLTDVRRAGSVEYNTNSFPAANSLCSFKSIQNGTEKVNVLLDGTDGTIYDATAPNKSTVFSKSAGAGKARFLGINNTLYIGDGVDRQEWMQPGAWPGAGKTVTPGTLIYGVTGGAQSIFMALGGITLSVVAVEATAGFVTFWFDTTNVDFPPQFTNLIGATLTFTGLVNYPFANGKTGVVVQVQSTTLGSLTVQMTGATLQAWTIDSGSATTGTGVTGGAAPAFVAGVTADNTQQWKYYGPTVRPWGLTAPVAAPVVTPFTASGVSFWTAKTALAQYVPVLDPDGDIEVALATTSGPDYITGRSYPQWNPLGVGTVTVDGLIQWTNAGTPIAWAAATMFAANALILDSNQNLQLVTAGGGGNSGGSAPVWATTRATATTDGALTWTCLGPGVTLSTASLSYSYSYHSVDGTVSTAAPSTTIYGGILGPPEAQGWTVEYLLLQFVAAPLTNVDQIWVWRTAQGQSTLIFEDAVPVEVNGYIELGIPDAATGNVPGLNALVIAPIAKAGNPPPARMTCPAYHLGRVWGIVDNRVVNSAGPDTNFNGNTVFPPLSQAIFPALAKRLLPVTVSNGGLLVWTSSGVQIILGTGTAANPFYATMYEPSVNLGGYDALDVLGSTIYFMESNGKVSSFDPQSGYLEIGFPVGDQFKKVTTGGISASLYDPSTTFLSWNIQSSGETAMYVADGAVGWFRMAAIAPPESGLVWCPRAAIAGGTSAVQSIETSPGNYDLLIGPASDGPILKRDTTGAVFGDNGTSYPAWDSKGVVRLCESGQVAEVAHIALKSMATGGPRPSVSILMDEVAPSTDAPWDELAISSTDPPDLEPSVSMYSDRYQALQNGVTPKGDCLLLKVDYGTNSFGDELLMFSIYGRKQEERVQQQ